MLTQVYAALTVVWPLKLCRQMLIQSSNIRFYKDVFMVLELFHAYGWTDVVNLIGAPQESKIT
jgi:hypothetical protein